MVTEFIKNKVYYKIYDKTHKHLSFIYNKQKYIDDAVKLTEIEKNLLIVKEEYKADQLLVLNQTHSTIVIDADIANLATVVTGDASVTSKKNIILSTQTADCVTVLLSCSEGNIIGAAHCGWRGAKANIIDAAAKAMTKKGAKNIKAIIGPSILQNSYEVDSNYYQDFINDSKYYDRFFSPANKPGHRMFDLPGFVKHKLLESRIDLLYHINNDTYSNPDRYPSYRRSCHNGEKYLQNILSTVVIK